MDIVRRKEGIERIDTNILVRLITADDKVQYKKIKKLFSQKGKIFVFEDASIMEVVYVLSGQIYRYSRKQVSNGIKTAMLLPNLACNKSIIEGALDLYVSHPKLSFVDCYLAVVTEMSGEKPLWTLDHKLATQCNVAREL